MTTIAVNSNIGNRRVPKEKKSQPNKANVAINSVIGDSDHNNHSNDKLKTDSKLQPTAEQIRIANLMNDNRDDLDLKDKIEQIIELTGSTRDEAVVALHDCDNDTAKAIDMILEGDSLIESDWRTTGKKKKPPKTSSGDDSKPDMPTKDSKFETNKDLNRSHNKSEKTNNRMTRTVGPPRLQRAALANKTSRKPKEFRNDRNEVDHNNDIFSTSAQQIFRGPGDSPANNRRSDRRGGIGRGNRSGNRPFGNRGSDRGSFSSGRGSRTFQNRGLNNDGFNTIDTWTNSTADQSSAKAAPTDCNTMTVGNWSDIAANEDWSEEDWDSSHMETKVFTPSTKALAENDELLDVSANIGANSSASQPLNFSLLGKPSVESGQHSHPHQHQSMSSILSANISRSGNVAASGAALLQQLQQSSSSQSSTLNQYSLSQYNKQATESIKSLVGLSSSASYNSNSDLLSSSERDLSNSLANSQSANLTNKASRMKVARSSSKIPESAVEMPTNDSIAALGVQFGALEFGTDNSSFSLGNDSSVFQDAVSHVTSKVKKSDQSSTLSSNSLLSATSDNTYRPSTNSSMNDGKVGASIIQNSVISHQSLTSDSLLDRKSKSGVNVGPYGQKVLDATGKNTSDSYSVSPQQTVNDITSNYKNAYSSTDSSGAYNSVTNYSTAPTVSYPYSSNSQSGVYGNQVVGNYTSNFTGSSLTNHSSNSTQKLREMDNNSQQKQYDISNAIVTNAAGVGPLGLIQSNSTVTTNVLKNTLSATGKGLHSVPPGVATPVLSTPYIMSNTGGLPIYPFPYDVQFQPPPTRDHNFATYAPQDVKYSRGSDSDVTSVSTSQTGAASQTHNQTFVNNVTFPPGYGFYFTPGVNLMTQSMYGTAAPIYPVTPAANTGSAGSAFSKNNTGYGSHSYNSSYDPITAVAQTQDYGKQGYGPSVQHPKGLSGSNADLSTANSAIYGKTHTQITKNYDKQSFQTSTPPPFNLNASAQSAASAYGAPYILPHNQASLLHHALQADANQTTATTVSAQRSMSQSHKGSAGTGSGYTKYNWS